MSKDKIGKMLDKAERREQIAINWRDHVESKHAIKSYSTILNNVMYTIESDKTGNLFPHIELTPDNETHWVVKISGDGHEVLRANLKSIDLIQWKLFPFQKTN